MSTSTPEWMTPGADVIVSHGGRSAPVRVFRDRIARVGKRDVVTEADERFRVDTCDRRTGSGAFGTRATIASAYDPAAVKALAQHERDRAVSNAETALSRWSRAQAKDRDPADLASAAVHLDLAIRRQALLDT